ncbi:hypothetical protein F7734_03390 [Scytonema sp. UIC 10036]|uniref:hypothetical protein n=1 Tax=Scytonema sp. UIC 10036 TaxID=2304196 RepID=UPI0012DA06D3|nr:hypothetical protein [Scytonema sp. UIC 10036]MUG91581.1 hypothetical protein [Scytonema sp. UIC 10036]
MGKKKLRGIGQDYSEVKINVNIALTPTAKKILHERAVEHSCRSISDLVEKWARGEIA